MDCRAWENQIDDYLADRLTPAQREQAETHLASCSRCRELLATARGNLDILSVADEQDLTGAILAATSGPACGRARELLGDLVEGSLPATDSQLVRAHLEHCPECAALSITLTWLLPQLHEMAELTPDDGFTADVMLATIGGAGTRRSWRERLVTWWQEQLVRPRFSWEAAYVGTLLLVLLFGTPVSPLKDAPPKALEIVQASPAGLISGLEQPATAAGNQLAGWGRTGWGASGGKIGRLAGTISADLAARRQRAAGSLEELRQHGEASREALFAGDLIMMLHHLGEMPQDIGQCWQDWWQSNGQASPDSTDRETIMDSVNGPATQPGREPANETRHSPSGGKSDE